MSNELSRRQIILMSALAAAAFIPIGKALGAVGTESSVVDAGPLADYAKDGVFDQSASHGFFVIRKDGKIFAQSSVCTHRHWAMRAMAIRSRIALSSALFTATSAKLPRASSRILLPWGTMDTVVS